METAIVNFEEISDRKKNPTLCLSAARYTGNCVNCNVFKQAQYETIKVKKTEKERLAEGGLYPVPYRLEKARLPIDKAMKRLKCKPFVSEEQLILLHKRDELCDEKEALHEEIKDIDDLLNMPLEKMRDKLIENGR